VAVDRTLPIGHPRGAPSGADRRRATIAAGSLRRRRTEPTASMRSPTSPATIATIIAMPATVFQPAMLPSSVTDAPTTVNTEWAEANALRPDCGSTARKLRLLLPLILAVASRQTHPRIGTCRSAIRRKVWPRNAIQPTTELADSTTGMDARTRLDTTAGLADTPTRLAAMAGWVRRALRRGAGHDGEIGDDRAGEAAAPGTDGVRVAADLIIDWARDQAGVAV